LAIEHVGELKPGLLEMLSRGAGLDLAVRMLH
jgi:hypothetical protein